MHRVLVIVLVAGCPKPPPPPSVTEPPRLAAEESCVTSTPLPPLPARFPADPYQISHAADMMMKVEGTNMSPAFLCDLPDHILGIGATQTVDGGKRVVGGTIYVHPRSATARALPRTIDISAASPGCKQGEMTCAFQTASPAIAKIEMLREQWVNTSGWVHGMDDMCRALPDDTIAVCSTQTRMAYVELGCEGALHLGIHDASLARKFDLDVESPMIRMRGTLDPQRSDAETWTFRFDGDASSVAAPTTKAPTTATLELRVRRNTTAIDHGWSNLGGTLTIDGVREPCIAWALYRR